MRAKHFEDDQPYQRRLSKQSSLWKSLVKNWSEVHDHILTLGESYVWKPEEEGDFTTKSSRKHMKDTTKKWAIAKHIRKSYIPIKLSIFA